MQSLYSRKPFIGARIALPHSSIIPIIPITSSSGTALKLRYGLLTNYPLSRLLYLLAAGNPSLVFDCIYNSSLKSRTLTNPEFKIFLVGKSRKHALGRWRPLTTSSQNWPFNAWKHKHLWSCRAKLVLQTLHQKENFFHAPCLCPHSCSATRQSARP